jgi:hypothetical protein
MDAMEVAPDTERSDVLVFVASAVRAEHEVMRRHVPARADRTRATEAVAPMNSEVLGRLAGLGQALAAERG